MLVFVILECGLYHELKKMMKFKKNTHLSLSLYLSIDRKYAMTSRQMLVLICVTSKVV